MLGEAVSAISKPMFTLYNDFYQPAPGAPFFSDRAVKTTGAEPQFLCVDRILSVQSGAGSKATATLVNSSGCSSSLHDLVVRLRLVGDCAVCVSRNENVVLQCRGTQAEQLHEIAVQENDALAILCNLPPTEEHCAIFRAALRAMTITNKDVEYCAEEMLLSLKHNNYNSTGELFSDIKEGTTAILGVIGRTSHMDVLPPLYSSTIEK